MDHIKQYQISNITFLSKVKELFSHFTKWLNVVFSCHKTTRNQEGHGFWDLVLLVLSFFFSCLLIQIFTSIHFTSKIPKQAKGLKITILPFTCFDAICLELLLLKLTMFEKHVFGLFHFFFNNLKYNQSYYGNKFVWPKVDKVGHIETLITSHLIFFSGYTCKFIDRQK